MAAHAQTTLPQEKELYPFNPDSSYFLADWVVTGSIKITIGGDSLSNQFWSYDEKSGLLHFSELSGIPLDENSRVLVGFEVFPFSLPRSYQPRKPIELDSTFFEDSTLLSDQFRSTENQQTFTESDLRQSGSLKSQQITGPSFGEILNQIFD